MFSAQRKQVGWKDLHNGSLFLGLSAKKLQKPWVAHLRALLAMVLAPALTGRVTVNRVFYLTFCIYTGVIKKQNSFCGVVCRWV